MLTSEETHSIEVLKKTVAALRARADKLESLINDVLSDEQSTGASKESENGKKKRGPKPKVISSGAPKAKRGKPKSKNLKPTFAEVKKVLSDAPEKTVRLRNHDWELAHIRSLAEKNTSLLVKGESPWFEVQLTK